MSIEQNALWYPIMEGWDTMIYRRIRDLREDHDYTQENIAQLLNCKQNTYQQYESGKRQIPIESLKKLAILYNTSIDYIVELTDEQKPYKRK